MALVKRFEDLHAWQEARRLTVRVYRLTSQEPLARDFGLRDQLQRAAVSVMANIAEGFDCESPAEFARFLEIARRSAVEVQSLLYVTLDAGYLSQETFDEFYALTEKVKALTGGLRAAQYKRSPKRGAQRTSRST